MFIAVEKGQVRLVPTGRRDYQFLRDAQRGVLGDAPATTLALKLLKEREKQFARFPAQNL